MKWLASFLLMLIFFTTNSFASLSCNVSRLFADPEIANDSKVWEAIGKVGHNPTDEDVKRIIRELHPKALSKLDSQLSSTPQIALSSVKIAESNNTLKHVQKLPNELKKKYSEFIETYKAYGEKALREKKGYHYEKLPQYGDGAHSVRLNDGVRVLFRIKPDGQMEILDVGQHIYPH